MEIPIMEWLLHVASKGAVVLGVALLAGLCLRRVAAARRYAVWMAAIGALGVLPVAMLLLPAWRVLPQTSPTHTMVERPVEAVAEVTVPESGVERPSTMAPVVAAPSASTPAPSQPVCSVSMAQVAASRITWDQEAAWLPVVWLGMTVLLLARLGWSAWRLRRLERALTPGVSDLLHETAWEVGLKRVPQLLVGASNTVPMVWGVWRPRLLLPAGFADWPVEKQRGVLLHELAHLQRRDTLALWTAQWVKALHWFNPLAWLTVRQLRADQERACDDTVLRHGVRPSDYAQHLLDLSRHARLAPGLALCALTITRCAPVETRVKAILDPKRSREGLTLRWLAGLAGLALLTTLPVAMLHAIEGPKLRGRILDRNGVALAESTAQKVRHYPFKALVANVTGHTGGAGPGDSTPTGRTAIEKQHDAELKEGRDVSLYLDVLAQLVATKALTGNVRRGGLVIMDPETGGILAYVSMPRYDANQFIPTITKADWEALSQDQDRPLLDRAGSLLSAPGAVFQPFTVLAAWRAGKTPGTYACTPLTREPGGGVRYGSVTRICRTSLREGAAHGPLTLEQALAKGCSSYFFQLGSEAGYPALFSMAADLGLQQGTNLFGAKSAPLLPTVEELAKTHSSQRRLNDMTTNVASGRGSPVTVLQMAALYSALANGKVWEPSLTKKGADRPRLDLNTLPGLPEGLARVRSALRDAVIHPQPWARSLADSKAQIAAMADSYATGAKGPHSEVFTHHYWMAGYAPADKPALAFALYVDETSSDSTLIPDKLGPMVRRAVEEILALPGGGYGQTTPVEDTGDRTAAKLELPQSGLQREAIAAAVDQIQKEMGVGLVIKTRQIGDQSVTLQGEAATLNQAVQLRDKLMRLGKEFGLKWRFPLSEPVPGGDGKQVSFQATATPQQDEEKARAEISKESLKRASKEVQESHKKAEELWALRAKIRVLEAGKPSNQAAIDELKKSEQALAAQWQATLTPPKAVRASQMPPADAEKWQVVQKAGALAELPQEAMAHIAAAKTTDFGGGPESTSFWFSAPRADVHRWLMASLSEKAKQAHAQTPPWPDAPQPFYRPYFGAPECWINIHSLDGKTVVAQVTRRKRPPMIAPDEATPPRSKTAAPKELDGVVSLEREMPDLAALSFWLLPSPTLESEARLAAFPCYLPTNGLRNPFPPPSAPYVWPDDSASFKLRMVEAETYGPEADKLGAAAEEETRRLRDIDTTLWVKKQAAR